MPKVVMKALVHNFLDNPVEFAIADTTGRVLQRMFFKVPQKKAKASTKFLSSLHCS